MPASASASGGSTLSQRSSSPRASCTTGSATCASRSSTSWTSRRARMTASARIRLPAS
ncbi:hypothetical protein ACFPRL_25985 [Pseudoclavibacter helvolus]